MELLDAFTTAEGWVSLLTLTLMEIVLGIDNIVFISILTGKLPPAQRNKASRLGLALALITRLGLLFAISWVMGLKATLFTVLGRGFSGRHLILLGGGLFLLAKSTHEIFEKLEVEPEGHGPRAKSGATFAWTIGQILVLDIVFSLDSVITAVGMAPDVPIMVVAMVVAVGVMLVFAGSVSRFIERHPSMKVLALSFLLLIGVLLVAEGIGQHISKGYIYFAMAFAMLVELINMWLRKRQRPVALHRPS
jgi:predicted tellurium resistance membrane protein TerC